ncbi:MAG: serine/threonine protein kinase [Blautia sp.]|nr:serine/threonine protein kinase [Blautia sp.]
MSFLAEGTVLKGRYEILKVLGYGGFGITYLARDRHLSALVALKELYIREICSRSESGEILVAEENRECFLENKEHFLSEARVLAMLNEAGEPGVVALKDHFEDHRTACIVMEYLKGVTLRDWVLRKHPGPEECLEVMEKVGETASHLHCYGILHKDISPENVMLLPEEQVKLMDFGSASANSFPENHVLSFKKGYAPPEQYGRGGRIGPWTDVYCVAATACFCLTGKRPPQILAGKDREWLKKVLGRIPGSRGLRKLLKEAMEPATAERIQSMEELVQGFQRARRSYGVRFGLSCMLPVFFIPVLLYLSWM